MGVNFESGKFLWNIDCSSLLHIYCTDLHLSLHLIVVIYFLSSFTYYTGVTSNSKHCHLHIFLVTNNTAFVHKTLM